MIEYLLDIIPRIQMFSKKLSDLTLLTNQKWVMFDDIENTMCIFIFKPNNELIFAKNGIIEADSRWEYVTNNSLTMKIGELNLLLRHAFIDDCILVLKLENGRDKYVCFYNQDKIGVEINNIEDINKFLKKKYSVETCEIENKTYRKWIDGYNIGVLEVEQSHDNYIDIKIGSNIYLNNKLAPDGRYRIEFMHCIHVKNGKVLRTSFF